MIGATVSSSGVGIAIHGWVATLIVLAAIVTAITILFKAGTLVVKRIVKAAEIASKMDLILREFKPNGGSSLRDAVDSVSGSVEALHQSLLEHAAQDERVQKELSDKLEALTK